MLKKEVKRLDWWLPEEQPDQRAEAKYLLGIVDDVDEDENELWRSVNVEEDEEEEFENIFDDEKEEEEKEVKTSTKKK